MPTSEAVSSRAVWSSRQRLILAAGWAVGAVAVTAAWWGVSGEAVFDDQFRWVAVGALGAIVASGVSLAWLTSGRAAVAIRCRTAIPMPEGREDDTVDQRSLAVVRGTHRVDRLVAASNMRYFHRVECPLVRGKPAQEAERKEHIGQHRAPCGVCTP
jgi:hypothetical protein